MPKKHNYICKRCGKSNFGYGKRYCKECNIIILNLFNSKRNLNNENNPAWKGEDAKYDAIHNWIRRHKPKPKLCENCKKSKRLQLANLSGKYLRDINDYKYLCSSCHSKFDGYNVKGYKGRDYKKSIGENNGRAKLKEKQVIEIRKLLEKKELTKTAIAKKFNVSIYPISAISRGILWKHIKKKREHKIYEGVTQ